MSARTVSICLLSAVFVLTGCPLDRTSDVACDRIYKECNLALPAVDNTAMDLATCQNVMGLPQNASFANCFAAAACGEMNACLTGSGAAPGTQPGAEPVANGGGTTASKPWSCTAQGYYTTTVGDMAYPYSASAFGFGETKAIASIQAETNCSSHLMGMAIASGGSISTPCATISCTSNTK